MVVDAASRAVPSIQVRRQISGRRISRRSRSSLSLALPSTLLPPASPPLALPLEDYGVGTSLSSPRALSSPTRSRTEPSSRSLIQPRAFSPALPPSLFRSLVVRSFIRSPRTSWSTCLASLSSSRSSRIERLLHGQHVCRTAFSTCPRSPPHNPLPLPLLLSTLPSFSGSCSGAF